MSITTVKIAYHLPTKKHRHIDSITPEYKGLKCECVCLKCNEKLIAVVEVKKKVKHFKHHTNIDCEGSQETALHELGKQILIDNNEIKLPKYGKIIYSNPLPEKSLEGRIPDVSATFEGEPIFFEILVHHAVDNNKKQFYVNGKYKSIEINLKECLHSTFEEIKHKVIHEVSNKEIFFWEDDLPIEPTISTPVATNSNNVFLNILLLVLVAIAACLGISSFFNKKKR